ncbi:unnamed protein product [Clonostachys rosea]|uniref:Uncharacterized protein n=1 Tax=Bionectria ochroleuca TaxID=29856 RepID=A0ABY6TV23_BIOOC|nr:unnamed protein product [Clonostachys rosea]
MICANTFGIWEYYGNSVTKAAKGCGLSPSPNPSGTTASGTSAGEQSTTIAGQPSTSTAPGQTLDIKTSSATQTTGQNGSAVTSKAASTSSQISNTSTLSTVSTRASTPGTSTPSSPVQSAAAGHAHFATPLMAAIVIALAGLC